jgi:hypothetical protein
MSKDRVNLENWREYFLEKYCDIYPGDSGPGGINPTEPVNCVQAFPHEVVKFIEQLLAEKEREIRLSILTEVDYYAQRNVEASAYENEVYPLLEDIKTKYNLNSPEQP